MGASGEGMIEIDTVFPEGSLVADALQSVSTGVSRGLKVTFVPDSSLGDGPLDTEVRINI